MWEWMTAIISVNRIFYVRVLKVVLDFDLQLRRVDEKREEAEARARELEKQVHKLI